MGKIVVADNAGFCFGVKRAVDAVYELAVKKDGRNIYTLGELIHNENVTNELASLGVRTLKDPEELNDSEDCIVVIRSHGIPKDVLDKLSSAKCEIVDLTCPFVKRIHYLVAEASSDNIIIIGKEDHPEVVGIKGWAGSRSVYIINSVEEADSLPEMESAVLVAQTTSTLSLWDSIINVLRPKISDFKEYNTICDTTLKRQHEAEYLAKNSDVVIVIGGKHSSNTEKLYSLCKNYCARTFHIDNIEELSIEKIANDDIISLIAGASTPNRIIMEVKNRMSDVLEQGTREVINEENASVAGEVAEAVNEVEEKVEAVEETAKEEQAEVAEAADNTVAEADASAADSPENEEDFASQLEKTFSYIRRGQLVTGTIIQISDSEICVNINYKSDGIIKKENLSAKGDENPMEMFSVGDTIEAEVVSLNDGEGNVELSRKSIESKLKWKNLVDNLEEDKIYTVKVDKVVKGGVVSKLEGYEAFIPASQMSLKYVEDLSEFVGQDIDVTILDVDKKQRRFVLSRKAVLQKEADEQEKKLYESFTKGDKVTGKIKRLTNFGAFVDIGGVDGLLHITDISWVKVKSPQDVLKTGDEIEVLILNVDPDKKRISLGLKQLSPKPWDLAKEKYPVGSIVEGKVVRILPFGAFVSLEPTIDGLVHVSQITNRRLEKVEEELRVGDVVKAKVMGVDPSKKRITLSMRALIPEEKKETKEETEDNENFKFEIPPVDSATSTLADFFPKAEGESETEE